MNEFWAYVIVGVIILAAFLIILQVYRASKDEIWDDIDDQEFEPPKKQPPRPYSPPAPRRRQAPVYRHVDIGQQGGYDPLTDFFNPLNPLSPLADGFNRHENAAHPPAEQPSYSGPLEAPDPTPDYDPPQTFDSTDLGTDSSFSGSDDFS